MVEVQAESAHRQDVENRNGPHGKSCHDVLVHGEVPELTRLESDGAGSQMNKMKEDEGNQQYATPAHHPRGEGRLDIALTVISNWSRSPAHTAELERRGDVKSHTCQQDDADHPEQLSIRKRG